MSVSNRQLKVHICLHIYHHISLFILLLSIATNVLLFNVVQALSN